MWHDPNGDLKKWQRDTGVSVWGDPDRACEFVLPIFLSSVILKASNKYTQEVKLISCVRGNNLIHAS